MILFKNFRLYNQITDSIRFPQSHEPYMITYFSENSTLFDDYPKLNLKLMDANVVVTTYTKVPRTLITAEMRKAFAQNYRLNLYSTNQKIVTNRNFIMDLSSYLNMVDVTFKPMSYRSRSGLLIKDILTSTYSMFGPNYQKVLVYSVDLNKPVKQFINEKLYVLWSMLKENNFNFDHLVIATIRDGIVRYRLVVKNRDFDITKITALFRQLKHEDLTDTDIVGAIDKSTNQVVDKVIANVKDSISPDNVPAIKTAVSNFLAKDKSTLKKLSMSGDQTTLATSKNVVIASVLANVNGNTVDAKKLVKNISTSDKTKTIQNINKEYLDEVLTAPKEKSTSDIEIVKVMEVDKQVDKKTPEHLFEKRKKDFQINLKKDLINCFEVLGSKDVPLTLKGLEIIPVESKSGEIEKSDISTVHAVLVDKDGKKHSIMIDVPKIDQYGTFMISGSKKCLVNQIALCPITFPKLYDSKFQSSYSQFHLRSKRTRREQYLEIYIGSYLLPLSVVCFYSFGFGETLAKYGVDFSISNKMIKGTYTSKIGDGKYVVLTPKDLNDVLQNEFCRSFARNDFSKLKTSKEFGTREYFTEVILAMTGRVNSTYLLQNMLDNIVDPVVKQVLINKQQPYLLGDIMHYMASKVVTGYKQSRNDISNQRIRNSEIIIHLVQKQLLAAHTEYKEKVLSGNSDAKFELSRKKLMTEFVMTEIVADMEYANPIEEMSSLTRVTPVGKKIGGIPDKGAITAEGRDIHPSMYGNIDPIDTPEGDNVGIVQHLTVDAYITTSRGLFLNKEMKEGENSGLLSTSTCMTPFIECNDGARVMFAANQARQAVPLKNPEPPAIQTGYESLLTNSLSNSFVKKSDCDGKVTSVTNDSITIKCTDNKLHTIDILPVHLKSGSGKNTLSVFVPTIKVGDNVKNNSIIAEGSCIKDGTISVGRNLCIAFMPYKGYNFEDGIVLSESLAASQKLTSIHGIIEEVVIDESDRVLEIAPLYSFAKKGLPLIRKTMGKIESLLGIESDESTDISAGQYVKKSPGGQIVDIEVFSNISLDKYPMLKELSIRTNKRYHKLDEDPFTIKGLKINGILIKFKIEQELHIGVGDKMTNRYGGKGIVSLIEKDEYMPVTPWGDIVDIVSPSTGIINRMNMGQLFETYMGLISRNLAVKVVQINNRQKITELLSKVFTILDKDPKKLFSRTFITNFTRLSDSSFQKFIEQTKNSKFVTLVVSPFKSPSRIEIGTALNFLGLKDKYKLKLPEYGVYTHYEVPVGYEYFLKLEHIGSEKIASRSTGPVTGKVMQPTAGKSKGGGQRLGELDTYSLISYNCPQLLAELFGPLSDDQKTKNEIISEAVQNGQAYYRPAETNPAKDLLNAYVTSLMLQGR